MESEKYKIEPMGYSEGYGASRYNVYSVRWFDGKKWRFLGGFNKDECNRIVANDEGKHQLFLMHLAWYIIAGCSLISVIMIVIFA